MLCMLKGLETQAKEKMMWWDDDAVVCVLLSAISPLVKSTQSSAFEPSSFWKAEWVTEWKRVPDPIQFPNQ